MRATPLAEARQLLEVVEVVHVLLLAVLVGGGGGVEPRGGSPSLEHVGGAQGGKRNQTVGVLVIFEAAPEQALDGLNGKVVVRHLSRGGQQAERSDSHGGWLPQRRFEPFDELLRVHHALMHERSQNLGVENGRGGGDVQTSVDAHSLSSFTHAGWRPHTDPMRVVHTLQSAQAR